MEVAYGTDIAALTPTFTYSEGATVTPSSNSTVDFSDSVIYTVIAEDNTTVQEWTVAVSVTNQPEIISADTDILTFELSKQTKKPTIDTKNHTIVIEVPYGTSVEVLKPIFTLHEGAAAFPISGVEVDFSNPITYTVTAQDGSTKQAWTVTVTVAEKELLNTATDFLTFELSEQTREAIIDTVNHTIEVEVEYGTDLTRLIPVFTLSEGATVVPAGESAVDFSTPVTYIATAQNGSNVQEWIVTVSLVEQQVLGIEKPQVDWKIYPNPTNQQLFIKTSTPVIVQIMDLNGRSLSKQKSGMYLIFDMSKFKEGLYLLTIKDGQNLITKKILNTN